MAGSRKASPKKPTGRRRREPSAKASSAPPAPAEDTLSAPPPAAFIEPETGRATPDDLDDAGAAGAESGIEGIRDEAERDPERSP